jgi:hypothetical protein
VSHHRVETTIRSNADDVVALLAFRPIGWLRGFLVLATRPDTEDAPSSSFKSAPWFRLGPPTSPADGTDARLVAASFVWWPHRAGDVFEQFRGAFRVTPLETGCVLELIGESAGGLQHRNQQVMDELIRMIGEAVDAAQASDE